MPQSARPGSQVSAVVASFACSKALRQVQHLKRWGASVSSATRFRCSCLQHSRPRPFSWSSTIPPPAPSCSRRARAAGGFFFTSNAANISRAFQAKRTRFGRLLGVARIVSRSFGCVGVPLWSWRFPTSWTSERGDKSATKRGNMWHPMGAPLPPSVALFLGGLFGVLQKGARKCFPRSGCAAYQIRREQRRSSS